MRLLFSFFFLFYFAMPASQAADALHVEGNQLYYGDRAVKLQGVAIGDPLLGREGRPLSDYEVIAHDWNANLVRISIHPGAWRDQERKHVLALLHENVQAALDSGMFVIIAWHAIGIPDGYAQESPETNIRAFYDTDFQLAKDFWASMAREFGRDGRILFELWNEPVWPVQADGSQSAPKWATLKPYWQELTVLIRHDSDNVLIATSNGWAYNLQGVAKALLDDKNTIYAWHVYAGTDGNDPEAWERNLGGLSDKKPVIVSEWGFEPNEKNSAYYGNAQNYGYLLYDRFIHAKGLHFTAWCWHPTWMPRMLKEDWKTVTDYGHFIKEILWRRREEELVRPSHQK